MTEPPAKRMKTCPFGPAGPTGAPVLQHAGWFANHQEQFTRQNMIEAHNKLGIDGSSFKIGVKIKAIFDMLQRHGSVSEVASDVTHISAIVNPARSGIWDAHGQFNQERFDLLVAQALPDDQTRVPAVTRAMFANLVGRGNGLAAIAWVLRLIPLPLSWLTVTNASLDELFEYFSDTYVAGHPAFRVPTIELFYRQPADFFRYRHYRKQQQDASGPCPLFRSKGQCPGFHGCLCCRSYPPGQLQEIQRLCLIDDVEVIPIPPEVAEAEAEVDRDSKISSEIGVFYNMGPDGISSLLHLMPIYTTNCAALPKDKYYFRKVPVFPRRDRQHVCPEHPGTA